MMQKILILMALGIAGMQVHAQKKPTPIEVVQAQLDAYNRQDLPAFSATFHPDVEVFQKLGDATPSIKGRFALEKRYRELFEKYPKNYSTLLGRISEANVVIDHEWITGREVPVKMMAIYEVNDGLITRCWFVR